MSRLPIIGGDYDSWGTVLNDYLSETAAVAVLSSSSIVGATTVDLAAVPPMLRAGSVIAIDAFTTQCELRSVTVISGNTINLDTGLKFAHASGDTLLMASNEISAAWYGLTGDGTDEWQPMQRLFKEATHYGSLEIRGGSATYYLGQPLLVDSGSRINRLNLRSRAGFSPVQAIGAMVMVGNGQNFFTATASDDTFTTPSAHGLSANITIAFNNPYGETLPGGITSGTVYYVKTVPTTTTFTISETEGGATVNISSDGSGWSVDNPTTGLARAFWESLYLTLTIADLNGAVAQLQQPSWTRNTRVDMAASASSPGSAIGLFFTGQIAYHDNIEVNPSVNCIGLRLSGSGSVVRGFNCQGVNSGDVGAVVDGDNNEIHDLWTESTAVGVRIQDVARGVVLGGTWLGAPPSGTAPMLEVTGTQTSYDVGLMRATGGSLMLNDTARGYSISLLSGATGDSDGGNVFGGLRQPYGILGPLLHDRVRVNPSSAYTVRLSDEFVQVNTAGGDVTITLPTAAGITGWTTTIGNYPTSGTNNVIIDPSGAETIDLAATKTLGVGESVTVVSYGTGYYSNAHQEPRATQTYTVTNVVTDRSYDADSVLIAELADVVGTLIADLQAKKLIS